MENDNMEKSSCVFAAQNPKIKILNINKRYFEYLFNNSYF